MQNNETLRIMVIGAHPDDCEIRCGGVAALWAAQGRGKDICFVSVTNGGAGHHQLGGTHLVQRRAAELSASTGLLGIQHRILPIPDGGLEPTLENRLMLIRLIREFGADLIITNRPNDYHPDHRYTSLLVQDSAYMLTVPHIAPEVPALKKNPVILYWSDSFQKPIPFQAALVIDIDAVFEEKLAMLHCHASQVYEWLPWLDGTIDSIPADEAGRKAWLKQWVIEHTGPVAERYRRQLVARYGEKRGAAVRQAEAFEQCEYGSRLDARQLDRFFGGL